MAKSKALPFTKKTTKSAKKTAVDLKEQSRKILTRSQRNAESQATKKKQNTKKQKETTARSKSKKATEGVKTRSGAVKPTAEQK